MAEQKITCILCPMGCRMTAEAIEGGAVRVKGNSCKRGEGYARQELLSPMRTVTSSVRVAGGAKPLCPVKTASAVPKSAIPKVLAEIHALTAAAPIQIGQSLSCDVAGTGVRLVATAPVRAEGCDG